MADLAKLIIGGLAGGIGTGVFGYGFNRMHKYRLIKDIPTSKIRSMAVGLVELSTRVEPEEILVTPFSKTDCVLFKYRIEEYRRHVSRDSKGRTRTTYRWDTVASGVRAIPFYAEDNTGRVLVEPEDAELNLTLKNIYLQRAGLFGGFDSLLGALGRITRGEDYFLDVSELKLEKLQNDHRFSFSSRVGDRKYYEYFLAPRENVYILGTAGIDDRAAEGVSIKKGDNEPTFIISNRSEKELLKSMRWQMIGAYLGGSVLIIVGILLILSYFQAI